MENLEILNQIQQLGCADETKCAITFKVYLDLKKTNKFQTLEYKYSTELEILYIKGKEGSNTALDIYLPVGVFENIDLGKIEKYQNVLCSKDDMYKSLFLAICDTSPIIIYYKLTQNLLDDDLAPITVTKTENNLRN